MSGPTPRKQPKTDPKAEDVEDSAADEVDETIRQALTEIDDTQKELDTLNEKASKEILQVETKYNKLRKPFYDKRAEIIDRIPNFWVNAIINHPQISMLIDEEEEDCLHFLNKVEVEEYENVENGFRIKFWFDENPFFENSVLTKEFQLGPNSEPHATSTPLQWKDNMDLSKKQKELLNRRKRPMDVKTFFSWFSDVSDPAADDIAEVIKDDLWPNPLQYYLTPDGDDDDNEEGDEEFDDDAVIIEEEDIEEEEAGDDEENNFNETGENGEDEEDDE